MSQLTPKPTPHPSNVPGDFYVENGCCTMCGVPSTIAPSLFSARREEDGYEHCFVSRQPINDEEVNQMTGAIACSETQCIRYKGKDPAILQTLFQLGEERNYSYVDED